MRTLAPALLSACLIGSAPAAMAADGASAQPRQGDERPAANVSSRQCGLSTPYNVQVDGGGVWLYARREPSADRPASTAVRPAGMPEEIFFHDGVLSIDQQVRQVSAADAERLRRMEDGARALMPQVAGLTRDTVALTFDVLADVTRAMTGSARKGRQVEHGRDRALTHVDDSLGNGRWDQDVFGEAFEANVERVFSQAMGGIVRSALWAAFTGRGDRLEARADAMDAELDRKVDARSAAIEARAGAMCDRVAELRRLQDALEYRHHGAPLAMLVADADAGARVAGR